MIKVSAAYVRFGNIESDLLVIPFFEERDLLSMPGVEKILAKAIHERAVSHCVGEDSERSFLVDAPQGMRTSKILLIRLGERRSLTPFLIKERFGKVYKTVEALGLENVGLFLGKGLDKEDFFEKIIEGYVLASYKFSKYKAIRGSFRNQLAVFVSDKKHVQTTQRVLDKARHCLRVVFNVRDHVSEPPNVLDPSKFREKCLELKRFRNVKVKVLDANNLKGAGLNCLYAVGQGSPCGSMLIVIEYSPRKSRKTVVLVGKGVTFDTGGYSLKNAKQILHMKGDMLGAAMVLEILRFAAESGSNTAIVGVIPVAENLIGERAFKPDDVIKTLSGKTVEVESTDAEGRLMLADALTYSLRFEPDELIDIATISGACYMSLGSLVAPYVTNSDKIATMFERASLWSGEVFVRIPLVCEYTRFLKSEIADLKNLSMGSGGGLIAAPVFLSQFVGNTPWMHVDLAGVDSLKEVSPIYPEGSTAAFGVKTILRYLDLT